MRLIEQKRLQVGLLASGPAGSRDWNHTLWTTVCSLALWSFLCLISLLCFPLCSSHAQAHSPYLWDSKRSRLIASQPQIQKESSLLFTSLLHTRANIGLTLPTDLSLDQLLCRGLGCDAQICLVWVTCPLWSHRT